MTGSDSFEQSAGIGASGAAVHLHDRQMTFQISDHGWSKAQSAYDCNSSFCLGLGQKVVVKWEQLTAHAWPGR